MTNTAFADPTIVGLPHKTRQRLRVQLTYRLIVRTAVENAMTEKAVEIARLQGELAQMAGWLRRERKRTADAGV